MNPYMAIALLIFVVLVAWPTNMTRGDSVVGSLFLAVIWPTLLIVSGYLFIKKYVFKRSGLSGSEVGSELEILGALVMTGGLLSLSLVYPHNPVVAFLTRPF